MTNTNVGVRLSLEDRLLLDKICKARGERISTFIRRAVRKELARLGFYEDEEVRKALELQDRIAAHTR